MNVFLTRTMTLTMAIFLFAQTSYADTPKQCESVEVQVNGLVCDFCARALEKVFGKRSDVDSIKVDLDEGLVKIKLNEGQSIDDETVEKLITDSGYNVVNIEPGC